MPRDFKVGDTVETVSLLQGQSPILGRIAEIREPPLSIGVNPHGAPDHQIRWRKPDECTLIEEPNNA